MNKVQVHRTKQLYPQLENALQFRLSRINEVEDFFIAEIEQRKKMSDVLNKYITALDYADKILLVLSSASFDCFICSIAAIMSAPVGIVNASISLVLLVRNLILKTFLKTIWKKRIKPRKIVSLVRVKLNIIEQLRSKTLTYANISHEDFTVMIREAENYSRLKQSIRMKTTERGNVERDRSIEQGKRIGGDEVIKQDERTSNNIN